MNDTVSTWEMATGLPANGSRRAKIVCTIGPASESEEIIADLMRLGMDVARLNFSHGTHEQHACVIERLRRVAARQDRSICILQDLQGPKCEPGASVTANPSNCSPDGV